MKRKRHLYSGLIAAIASTLCVGISQGSELIYYPLNPSFGGSPLNCAVLLNSAQATNKHKDPEMDKDRYGIDEKPAIDQFNETLERTIISRLAASASSKIVDEFGNFIPGTIETQNFTISVSDPGTGLLQITTTDRISGGMTVFEVSKK